MLWIGVYNYFMLKSSWRSKENKTGNDNIVDESDTLLGGDLEMASGKSEQQDVRSPRQLAQHSA
jgi:hypothetical protein